jgi:hypothetical protein
MTDQHAQAYYFGPGGETAQQSGEILNYDPGHEDDAGFGTGLQRGVESGPDGDMDTDDIGSYVPLNKPQGPPYFGNQQPQPYAG